MPLHHLIVGTWTKPGAIFTFQFDDEALTLDLVNRADIPHDEPISWMTFNHDKKNIYGASMKTWSSYTVKSPTDISQNASHPIAGDPRAASKDTNTRAIFVLAAKKPPYNVYGNPFYDHAGYGNVFDVTEDGHLKSNVQNYEYEPKTGIHGMVFDPTETYLYSADMGANKIWTHKKDAATGQLSLVGSVDAPKDKDRPRWVEMHPSGNYLYALMESGNTLAEYTIDAQTHLPVFTHHVYPLIPPGLRYNQKNYRADVVQINSSGTHLFATTRSNTIGVPGYISAFELDPVGSINRHMFMNPTSSSGGHSNAVAPCPWSDEWIAITDDTVGFIEIYRWDGEFLGRVARCECTEPGFGMNAIWYD
ncbi:carboxy-cis,cis-muconate cyclase [Saccharata proteae CBS 121410]|uniref:Carboxy-cis,cis-muconate cyclase n=1 Tax=Saccharata proteae CBS 121410 TaxID=1314787 RepID=A0A9P4HSG1_9PEZI|nr:carboxy-cis,cis-muconate cyclase [Saccharata proteae CBS 121410]